jgi:ribosomal protein L6P/L9E
VLLAAACIEQRTDANAPPETVGHVPRSHRLIFAFASSRCVCSAVPSGDNTLSGSVGKRLTPHRRTTELLQSFLEYKVPSDCLGSLVHLPARPVRRLACTCPPPALGLEVPHLLPPLPRPLPPAMSTAPAAAPRLLSLISTRQFQKYLGRLVWHAAAAARVVPPAGRLRSPTTPGVGIFLYPADERTKTSVLATGPLGRTHETIHPSRFEVARPLGLADAGAAQAPELLYWGVGGALRVIRNLMSGVSEGFAVNLELHGVGYRAEADKERNVLTLRLGLSHVVEMPLDDGDVFFNVRGPQSVQVAGINRAKVHQRAAKVRALRPPEPYKGKGIRYQNEVLLRKESKKDA